MTHNGEKLTHDLIKNSNSGGQQLLCNRETENKTSSNNENDNPPTTHENVTKLTKRIIGSVRLPTYVDSSLLRYYSLPDVDQKTLVSILWQLCESHPQITFAPTLFPIVALFLHKHDQENTYQNVCKLLQKNQLAARDRQFKRILMPTTRLEHVRDVIVLIKLCTKFGIFAPIFMRELVREERRFLARLESSSASNNNGGHNTSSSYLDGCHASFTSSGRRRSSTSSARFRSTQPIPFRNQPASNGNTPSHDNNNNNNTTTTIKIEENELDEFDCSHNAQTISEHLQQDNLPVFDTPFFDWYQWIFVALPLTYCMRILDCWLVDGQKFLYQIALAILSRFRQSCDSPVILESDKMFQFCTKLETILEPKGGVEQLIKEAKSLKRISTVRIAKASRKAEAKAGLIVESLMRKNNLSMNHHGHKGHYLKQPREDMLNHIIISSRIAPRSFKSSIVDNFDLLDDLWQYIPERAAVKTVEVVFNSNNDGTSLQTFFSRVDPYEETMIIIRTIKNEVFGSYCSSSWSLRKNQAQSAAKKSYYFGNGETFLFTLQPKFSVYLWVGKTEQHDRHHDQHYNQHDYHTANANQNHSGQQFPNENVQLTKDSTATTRKDLLSNHPSESHYQHKHRDSVSDMISTQLFMSATSQELIIGSGNGSFGLWLDADLTRGKTDHCRTFNNHPLCADKDFTCKDVEVLAFA